MEEMAKFGQPQAKFVHPRFLDIRQVQGVPNQVGSVIRYRVPLVGIGHDTAADQKSRLRNLALSGRREAGGPRENHFQRRSDQGRKPPALHLRGVRLQERQGLREPDDVEGRQIVVSGIRARRRVEPCPVHHQGRGRAKARPHREVVPGVSKLRLTLQRRRVSPVRIFPSVPNETALEWRNQGLTRARRRRGIAIRAAP